MEKVKRSGGEEKIEKIKTSSFVIGVCGEIQRFSLGQEFVQFHVSDSSSFFFYGGGVVGKHVGLFFGTCRVLKFRGSFLNWGVEGRGKGEENVRVMGLWGAGLLAGVEIEFVVHL